MKQVSFRLRNALVIATLKNNAWTYKALINGSAIALNRAQYMRCRHEAGLPDQISFQSKRAAQVAAA